MQTTYSKVVEHTRAEMAGELLESTDASIAEIAHRLGYKNQGDFTHPFLKEGPFDIPNSIHRHPLHAPIDAAVFGFSFIKRAQ